VLNAAHSSVLIRGSDSSGNSSLDLMLRSWNDMPVRKLIAALLLVCFGILIPMAASPVRICTLEENHLVADVSKCCSGCDRETEEHDPCCLELEALPDASAPQPSVELPPLIVSELPQSLLPGPTILVLCNLTDSQSAPIRGANSPAAYRAVLGIWRL
jgi:hypothetical protein